tara:strand:+ start:1071 stop:1307 length:237 start_codon:yes stop_codon:yes gene_type:complete
MQCFYIALKGNKMEVTWHMDGREEKYYREMLALGKAMAELRNLIRRKRQEKLLDAKLSYDELDNLLDTIVMEMKRSQL